MTYESRPDCPICGHDHLTDGDPMQPAIEKYRNEVTSEVMTLARQWANCEPGSLPDGIARNRMRKLFGLDD